MAGMRLGYLALGADDPVQSFIESSFMANLNRSSNVYNGKLYTDQIIGSFSYVLHIGSAAFDYPVSLVFGGYNKGRIIGPMTSFSHEKAVDLLDIGIGVEYGESPFQFDSKQNLLVGDTEIIGKPLKVWIDPTTPYLSLPHNTCEGLANILPINLDHSTRYYHWKTDDPLYKSIVTSPSYLSFTFPPANGASKNVTVKVPFALLNLTLDKPIVDRPTPYFPCNSFTPGEKDNYRLGRAFLQAAFIGRNWANNMTWLGQAPGPGAVGLTGLGDELLDLAADATKLDFYDSEKTNYFNQSWAGHWSVIESAKTTSSNGTDTSSRPKPSDNAGESKGLSTGAKAGIGVGTALAGFLAISAAVLFWRRRSNVDNHQTGNGVLPPEEATQEAYPPPGYFEPSKQGREAQSAVVQEMHTESEVQELPDTSDTRRK
jgi:hypothetical protein